MSEKEDLSFIEETAGDGQGSIRFEDKPRAFIRILASLSPACTEGSDAYNPDAKPGMFINSLTGELLGKSIEVVPIMYDVLWVEWKPKRGGYVAAHKPYTIPVNTENFAEWLTPNGNVIVETFYIYCRIPKKPEAGIVIFDLTSTAIKHAKKWIAMMSDVKTPEGKQAATYTSVWEVSVVRDTDGVKFWNQIGYKKGATAIKWVRFITKDEFLSYVNKDRKMLEELIKEPQKANLLEASKNTGTDLTPY